MSMTTGSNDQPTLAEQPRESGPSAYLCTLGPLHFQANSLEFAVVFRGQVVLFLGRTEDSNWACLRLDPRRLDFDQGALDNLDSQRLLHVLQPATRKGALGPQGRLGLVHFAPTMQSGGAHTAAPTSVELSLCSTETMPASCEQWVGCRTPKFANCELHALSVSAGAIAFELAFAVQLLRNQGVLAEVCIIALALFVICPLNVLQDTIAMEQDLEDGCVVRFVLQKNQRRTMVHTFRADKTMLLHLACGCTAAPHEAKTASLAHTARYRFAATLKFEHVCNLAGWLACCDLPDSAALMLTLCSKHGLLRVCPADTTHYHQLQVLVDIPLCVTLDKANIATIKPVPHIKPQNNHKLKRTLDGLEADNA